MNRLLLTCTDLMALQFLVPHVKFLSQNGFSVELACSDVGGRLNELRDELHGIAKVHTVRLVRSPFSPGNLNGYKDLKKLINSQHWDIIWTNEPVMGVMTRLAARKARRSGTNVIYMAHGFHFYKGAPKLNWLIYYPVEKFCSRFCDMIITINNEDYQRAKTFHAKRVEKINGIGVETAKYATSTVNRDKKRHELDIPIDAFFIVSVGELKDHKNHMIIIKALSKLKEDDVYFGICGKGELLDILKNESEKLGLGDKVKFFGYRKDVPEILHSADLFAFPSKRDGLGLAAIEAMSAGLPLLTSKIRGVTDYVIDGVSGYSYLPDDAAGFANGIERYYYDSDMRERIGKHNSISVYDYDLDVIRQDLLRIMNSV